MNKKDVVAYFGGIRKTARALDYSASYVCEWPESLPKNIQYRVQVFTNNHFVSEDTGKAVALAKGV